LDDGLSVVVDAEPVEILENPIEKFRTAAAGIEVLDPEEELPAAATGSGMAARRRISMAQM